MRIIQKQSCLIDVLTCDIHTRQRTKRILKANGAEKVYALDEYDDDSINGSGHNDAYGLCVFHKATEETVKLFLIKCEEVVQAIHAVPNAGKNRKECGSYGLRRRRIQRSGRKDLELADPEASAYTSGLEGNSDEVKLKISCG